MLVARHDDDDDIICTDILFITFLNEIEFFFFGVKWLQVFLSRTNNSI